MVVTAFLSSGRCFFLFDSEERASQIQDKVDEGGTARQQEQKHLGTLVDEDRI